MSAALSASFAARTADATPAPGGRVGAPATATAGASATASSPTPAIAPTAAFRLPSSPAARLHHQIRLQWPITRPELAASTGLSQPTVARGVTALLDAGLVEERPDMITGTGAGRPRIPLAPAKSRWLHVGAHMGLHTTHIAIFDTVGRVLRETDLDLPLDAVAAEEAIDSIIAGIHRLRTGIARPLRTVGAALSGHVAADGTVTSRSYGWGRTDLVGMLSDGLGLPALAAPDVAAMAASELAATPLRADGERLPTSLYFYARELIGVAWTVDGAVHRPAHGDGSISHLRAPVSDLLGGETLKDAVGATGVLAAARDHGVRAETMADLIAAAQTNATARAILDERARILGLAVANVADIVDPAHVILAGAAFTDDAAGLRVAARTIADVSPVRRDIRVSRARGTITRDAARAVALDPLHSDPLSLA
ncbi:ROK family protein [Corynebacterium freneyi]|uniref:ROK family transcriptional regulator n=1 Tax=Corynebacterium freneyi TaxID=134034 RepID=UPI00254A50EA|nr:ROK family transcriptional regulator [Corynebacterium freneyi]MDK8767779.1 ROK family transcriptional regulator [Corynebacterium freneyi]